ncbi:MAG TPA: glutathione S-transferase N-terminal domain-containing protein, partial [Thermoleophilaceae bacterium]
MKLYVCYGTWKPAPRSGGKHPCGRAYHALRDAGHDPEVIKSYGLGIAPDKPFNQSEGRQEAKRLTGKAVVPVLVTDDGEVVSDSRKIEEWAKKNPAGAAATS